MLFWLLDSAAQIQQRGYSIGGALAGFTVVFMLLRWTYFAMVAAHSPGAGASSGSEVQLGRLEQGLRDLVAAQLDNFTVPPGYVAEISPQFRFAFCYPEGWEFGRFPASVQYGFARDAVLQSTKGVRRQLTITISDVSGMKESDVDAVLEANASMPSVLLPNAHEQSRERFLFHGRRAIRQELRVEYRDGDQAMAYNIAVANAHRTRLFNISFMTDVKDFPTAKQVFDDIAATFRV